MPVANSEEPWSPWGQQGPGLAQQVLAAAEAQSHRAGLGPSLAESQALSPRWQVGRVWRFQSVRVQT